MLVSTMVRFNAMNTANNANFASVQANNSMVSAVDNAHTFNGVRGLQTLNKMDKKFSLDILVNNLSTKLARLQEKSATKSLNVLA